MNAGTLEGIDQGCQELRRATQKGERASLSVLLSGLSDAHVVSSRQKLVITAFVSLQRWESRL